MVRWFPESVGHSNGLTKHKTTDKTAISICDRYFADGGIVHCHGLTMQIQWFTAIITLKNNTNK